MLTIRPLVVLLVLLAGAVESAHATFPGANGRIVFERLRRQENPVRGELFVANPDGTGIRKLTHPPNGTEDAFPDWSPDGKRIVFQRQPPTGAYSIWTIGAGGDDLRRVSPPCPTGAGIPKCAADDGWPAWSPDGRHIAFERLSGALTPKGATLSNASAIYRDELVVTDADGSHVHTLLWLGPWRGDPQAPAWSPDGRRLAFIGKFMTSRTNGSGCECRALYVISADGRGLRKLTPAGMRPGGRPDWSPDGRTILFRTHPGNDPSGVGANLYTIHPDGPGLRQLTHFTSGQRVLDGSYSPDARSIVFSTSAGTASGLPDVFVMDRDGTHMRAVTRTPNFETDADWGPGFGIITTRTGVSVSYRSGVLTGRASDRRRW